MALVQNQVEPVAGRFVQPPAAGHGSFALSQQVEGNVRSNQSAGRQEDDLDDIGQGHRLQPPIDGVDAGKGRQSDDAGHQRHPYDVLDGQGTEVEDGSQVDEYEYGQPKDGHDSLHPFVEPLF